MTELIQVLTDLPGHEWQRVANAMKYVRVWETFDQNRVPEILRPLESADQWFLIHAEVTRLRRAAYRAEKDRQDKGRRDRRREYMRRYMSTYRKKD